MNRSKRSKKKRIKIIALSASLCVWVFIYATAAFLTSSDSADNTFRIGKVDLEIEETFDEDKTLAAGQIINKQPQVKNTGTVDELFFVEVYVPCMKATFLNSSGQRIAPEGTEPNSKNAEDYKQTLEIFNLKANGDPAKDFVIKPEASDGESPVVIVNWELSYNKNTGSKPGWVFLENDDALTTVDANHKIQGVQYGTYRRYLFGYSAWVEPNEKTIPVFDTLQLRSIIDADIAGGTIGQVQVNAYGIQASDLEITTEGRGTGERPYTQADLSAIYKVVDNKQNS